MSTELSIYDRDPNNEWISVDERVFQTAKRFGFISLLDNYFSEIEKSDKVVLGIYLSNKNAKLIKKKIGMYLEEENSFWTADIIVDDYWGDKVVFSAIVLNSYAHNEDILRRFEIMEI